jgi:hypothetical protein
MGVEPTTSPSLLSKAAIYYLLSKLQLWKVKLRLNIEPNEEIQQGNPLLLKAKHDNTQRWHILENLK